jgi:hypothetical protein
VLFACANGNQTTRKVGSNTYNLIYDAENRLEEVSGAANATFVYRCYCLSRDWSGQELI